MGQTSDGVVADDTLSVAVAAPSVEQIDVEVVRLPVMLRVDDVARIVGLDRGTVYRQVSAGVFPVPHHKIGGAVRFSAYAVHAWLRGQ